MRRRQFWLAGRDLLLALLAVQLPHVDAAALRTDARGAVRYDGDDVHVSLSHSGDLLAAALATCTVGVDIEWPRPRACIQQARRLFTGTESRYLQTLQPADRETEFYALWTLKEALAKAAGISMWDALRDTEFDLPAGRCRVPLSPHTWSCLHARSVHGWHLAIATQDAAHPLQVECWRRTAADGWLAERLHEQMTLRSAAPLRDTLFIDKRANADNRHA
ncbi:MAG: 4'-phosphopantetheinyl transferase superfamily protein [Gammaproteobacteria bacterium]|nr:4'-phosphopantetheinyl transferase superfamily protein [Gammaproteobacteria bacterium]MDE1983241.1 4'-phosphopantetheinyl transferase superfamily protein [Gammaproteobacteria bacterium]MDE2462057.1 4'-phosphopantetheinyl transferase superfamily protein [Gammaproteobacteria bacterium]